MRSEANFHINSRQYTLRFNFLDVNQVEGEDIPSSSEWGRVFDKLVSELRQDIHLRLIDLEQKKWLEQHPPMAVDDKIYDPPRYEE